MTLRVTRESPNRVDLLVGDAGQFEIPRDEEPFHVYDDIEQPEQYDDYAYEVQVTQEAVLIRRKDETIFSLEVQAFSPLYQEFSTVRATPLLFGLGERNQKGFRFREGIYTLYSKDVPQIVEDGQAPGKNVYSSQPAYLMKEQSGSFHVCFYKTSSPMDVLNADGRLTFKTIGGNIHVKLFLGQDPDSAVRLYHQYLGNFTLAPFWAFGYQASHWGYESGDRLLEVIQDHLDH